MALPLGKLTILVGAGVLGSVLVKEGRVSDLSNFFSGALKDYFRLCSSDIEFRHEEYGLSRELSNRWRKIVLKQIQRDDSSPSNAKPQTDSLLAQVNSLRKELQLLASNRSVTVVTTSGSGARAYGVPVVVVIVVGYGYIWWKGWKLSDMMFATRRSLSDACNTVARQLEQVSASISAAKRHLSSRIDRADSNLDECSELTAATKEEVSQLRGDMRIFGVDVESIHRAVETLETKIGRIEGKQDLTNDGVKRLCDFVWNLESSRTNGRPKDFIQASPSSSSRPALESPQITPSSRTLSLPHKVLSLEPVSPSASCESQKVSQPLHSAASGGGLKELQGISDEFKPSNGTCVSENRNSNLPSSISVSEDAKGSLPSTSSRFGWKFPVLNAPFLTRTQSGTSTKIADKRQILP